MTGIKPLPNLPEGEGFCKAFSKKVSSFGGDLEEVHNA
jgi:hypothetical protein